MSRRTLTLLAVAVVLLFAAMYALDSRDGPRLADADLLLPGLKDDLNGVESVSLVSTQGTVGLAMDEGRWVVSGKSGYPADTPALRALLLALADARRIEPKTSNPELYDRLGVQDPAEENATGVLVQVEGADMEAVAVILGDVAQGDYRYARLPGDERSWLIDRNPQAAKSAEDWLAGEIADIPSSRIREVSIRHSDGEQIVIRKDAAEESNYRVQDVPEGRELSYPSVANSIAGVLSNLRLEDVRREAETGEPDTSVSFLTFDGLRIDVSAWSQGGEDDEDVTTWISLRASASGEPPAESPVEATEDHAASSEEESITAAGGADDASRPAERDPEEQAAMLNERVGGWQYLIADYKARQLTRRWDNLLAAVDEDSEED